MKPLVSVVVATYRRDSDLSNALASLANQDYVPFEIVVVDDNAAQEWNEKVKKIVCEFQNSFPDIPLRYIVNCPNQGSAQTRNIGIEAASGEYITRTAPPEESAAAASEGQTPTASARSSTVGRRPCASISSLFALRSAQSRFSSLDTLIGPSSLRKRRISPMISGTA